MRAVITRARRLQGALRVPGDKSISHRAVLFGALARGTTRVHGLSPGGDVRSTIECLRRLGVEVREGDGWLEVVSAGRSSWRSGPVALDAGNSGTTARILMGVLAPVPGLTTHLTGDASLVKRPMRRVAEPLSRMGATIALAGNGTLPATITGRVLSGTTHSLNVASAQVKTALLLAGLAAEGETWIREPSLSRDHTERMLPLFGADVLHSQHGVGVHPQELQGASLSVPGDPSSAAFFAAAAAMIPGSDLTIEDVSLNPTRIGFLQQLKAMGASTAFPRDEGGEPAGTWHVQSDVLRATRVMGEQVPGLIDEVPILAVVAAMAKGTTEIRDAAELRVKESDRIALVVKGLRAMGAEVEELPDGLIIEGGRPLRGAVIDSEMDHRIAMAFSVAGLVADGETVIEGAEWAATSFPNFFRLLSEVSGGAVPTE